MSLEPGAADANGLGRQPAIALEVISGLSMPPVDFVHLAHRLGCASVSLSVAPMHAENPYRFPAWSLRDDTAMRAAVRSAAEETGVRIATGEYFLAMPGMTLQDQAADMDILAEIGAQRVVLLNFEPDAGRALDQCALFVEMASARGLRAMLEFLPGENPIHDFGTALDFVSRAGSGFQVVIDAMHFYHSGSTVVELAAADPARIGHVQLCDVPLKDIEDYGMAALNDRLAPGEGELPLAELVAAMPATATAGLELPQMGKASAGVSLTDILTPALRTSRQLLAAAGR